MIQIGTRVHLTRYQCSVFLAPFSGVMCINWEATMNLNNDTREIAEMFADMTDIFCESVDSDGLHMLLTYCLEATGLETGEIAMLPIGKERAMTVHNKGQANSLDEVLPYLVQRALNTLQSEFSVIGNGRELVCEYAFPLRVRGVALGVIHLTSIGQTALGEHSIAVLQSIADIAATTIDQTHRIQQAHSLVTQLQGALDSRVVIEQAKGILAERNRTDFPSAFHEIRSIARREQRPVRTVAADIVAGLLQAS